MSVLTANRRALSSVCRLSSCSTAGSSSSRLIHSSCSHQAAAALSPSGLGVEGELEEISIQPIFDIFDAPTRLAESSEFIRSKYASKSKAPAKPVVVSAQAPTTPPSRTMPSPLPAPIIFDGPARPKNEAFAFQRRMRDAGLAPSPHPRRTPNQIPSARAYSSSEPAVQLFDGPAKITRYHHQSTSDKEYNSSSSKYLVAVGVAGAIGYASIMNNHDESRSSRR
ncbi:hypothetical protein CPC08DRAFT_820238 [Agrocybe pediades]|nr:hypothetical protein CPC08DRAFT_820238 [Agrocybe pediades]